MPNVTIKGYQESISVDFGDLFPAAKTKRSRWRKDALIACFITDTDAVVIRTVYKQDFVFSHNGAAGTLRVDAVDDVQPMSPTHLFDLITSHIG
jgi:hypothetical protein